MAESSIVPPDECTHLQSMWRPSGNSNEKATSTTAPQPSQIQLLLTAVSYLEPIPISILAHALEEFNLDELKRYLTQACDQQLLYQPTDQVFATDNTGARSTSNMDQSNHSLCTDEETNEEGTPLFPSRLDFARRIWNKAETPEELSQASPIIVRQYVAESTFPDDSAERQSLARLCLMAGESSAKSSEFSQAFTYLQYGIDLLGDFAWARETYDCSLALHNAAAEMLMVQAKYEDMEELVDTILKNIVDEQDAWLAKATRLQAMGAKGDENAAIDYGLDFLEELGEKLPRKGTTIGVMWRMMTIKRLLRSKTDEELMAMKPMTDPRKLACMRTLNILVLRTVFVKLNLVPIVGCKFIELTLRYGMSAITPNAFACFSLILGKSGDLENADRMGKLSLRLLEQLDCVESLPCVYAAYYGTTFMATNPRLDVLPKLVHGFEVGMQTGDVESACMNSCLYCLLALEAGVPLDDLRCAWEESHQTMDSFRQEALLRFSWASMQAVYSYIGNSDDRNGKYVDNFRGHDELCQLFMVKNVKPMVLFIRVPQMVVAYVFNEPDFPYLWTCIHLEKEFPRLDQTTQWMCSLWLLKLARSGKLSKRTAMRHVTRTLAYLRRLVRLCPVNFLEKQLLVEAEVAALRNRPSEAVCKYLCCIGLAHKSEKPHVEAMANERAARYMQELGRTDESRQYIEEAANCYCRWGANAKVKQLHDEFPFLVDP